jgi:two-component system, sensor histidine kinase and response regulator
MSPPTTVAPQKILVIDDEPFFREATALALQRRGYETHEAPDGVVGAEIARSVLPDLIICDVNMDRMDGYALLEHLRKDPITATIPFILMTGMSDAAGMRRGMELGADDYLPKPFTGLQLFSAVEARLAKQQVLRQSAEKKLADLRTNLSLALPHEMITPLNGIYGLAQLLATDAGTMTPEEVADYGQTILQSAERLHRTVQNFLLFGQLEMQASDGDTVRALRDKVTEAIISTLESRAQHLANNAGRLPDLLLALVEARVAIGRDLFTKLADELIDNAFKFSAMGTAVTVTSEIKGDRLSLAVQDRGPGMSPDQIASIGAYSQFNREHREQQGSGLGLAIARRIAELHGGTLSIESTPGKGTTVMAALPIAPPP